MYDCIVVVPIYKNKLSVFEQISLQQVKSILGKHDICFVAPNSLVLSKCDWIGHYLIERFEDKYFESVETYSHLLLNELFYQRFDRWEYMLVYQLDAFVFVDKLKEYCALGYDYIGAPLYSGLLDKINGKISVCNGGFSLRNIKTVRNIINKYGKTILSMPYGQEIFDAEDTFFAYCGVHYPNEFRVPSLEVATVFSAESNIGGCINYISRQRVPFGTHSWIDTNYHIWKPIIEGFGFALPDINVVQYEDTMEQDEVMSAYYLGLDMIEAKKEADFLERFDVRDVCIYGAGKDGALCNNLIKRAGGKVRCFLDKKAETIGEICGIPVYSPYKDDVEIQGCAIIISSRYNESEIEGNIKNNYALKSAMVYKFSEIVQYLSERCKYEMNVQYWEA